MAKSKERKVEQALQESEERFRLMADSIRDGITIVEEGQVVYVNERLSEIFGYSRDELMRMSGMELAAPEERERLQTVLQAAREEGQLLEELQYWAVRKDGSRCYVRNRYSMSGEAEGVQRRFVVTFDITEQKQAEQELQKSEERFRDVALSTSDWVWEVDGQGRYTYCSERVVDALGYTAEEILGKTPFDLMPPDEAARVGEIFGEIAANKQPIVDLENVNVRKDGQSVHLLTNGVPILDEAGNLVGYRGVDKDITERQQAEEVLLRLERAVEQSIDGIAIPDLDGNIQFVNSAWAQMHGYGVEELLGQNLSIFHTEEQLQEDVIPFNERVMEVGANQGEVGHVRKDGTTFPTWMTTTLLKDEEGNPVGLVGTARDITERRQLEDRQVRLANLYSQFSALQTELLSPAPLEDKLKQVTDWTVDHVGADFARIWVIEEGDLCADCMHAQVMEGDHHICLDKERCLHLRSSSGRYTHIDGEVHRRVPFGAYKIGRVAGGVDDKFLTNDVPNDARVHNLDWARELGLASFAGYKLATPEEGVLGVFALFSQQTISPEEDTLLESIASAISLTVRASALEEERAGMAEARAQELREIAQRRAEEVRLSTEVAQEVAGAPALDELYNRVVTLVKERFGYYHAQIFRHDPEADAMVVVEGYGEAGAKMKAAGHSLPYGTGVVGTAAATGEPVLAADVTADPNWVPHPELPETQGELAVPIKLRDEVLGVLDVQSDEAGALSEEDQVLLLGLAGQIASAIESKEVEARIEAQVQERTEELAYASTLLEAVLEQNPVPMVLCSAPDYVIRMANPAAEELLGVEDEENKIGLSLLEIEQTWQDFTPDGTPVGMAELPLALALQGIKTDRREFRLRRKDGTERWDEVSGTPIYNEAGELIAGLIVFPDITDRKQLEERQSRLAGLYSQFSELQTELLAPTSLEDKLKQVTDWTVDYVGADFARIWVIEEGDLCADCMHAQVMEGDRHICLDKERCLHLRSSSGRYTHIDGEVHRRVPFGAYKIGRVAGGVDDKFLTNDVPNDTRVHNLDWARELGLASFAGYKLATPEEGVLGVFALFSQQTISPEEDALLESISSAISLTVRASALEEERAEMAEARTQELREIAQRRAEEVQLSTEVAQEVAGAPVLDELYNRVVTLVKERFGYYHAQIFRHDPETDAMVVVEGYGEAGAKMKAAGHSLPYGAGVVGTAAATGEPVLAADVTADPNWVPHPELPETQGELAVPIKLRDEVLGVLDVQSDEAGALSEEDQVLLLGLAGQIASAIESTQALEQAGIFRQFADTSGQGFGMATLDGLVIYVNPTLCGILGLDRPEDAIGQTLDRYYPEAVQQRLQKEVMPAVMQKGQWTGELALISTTGKVTPTLENFFVIRDDQGEPRYLANVMTDITERTAAETEREQLLAELQESGELLQATINATPDWIFIKDQQHRFQMVNRSYADDHNLKPEDVIGKDNLELGWPEELVKGDPEKGIRGIWADDLEVMDSGQVKHIPREPVKVGDELHLFATTKVPLRDADGNVWGLVGFARDVTEREQLLADVQQSEILLSVRVQELDCLNDIGRKIEEVPPVPEFLAWVAERIPAAMEYSDVCVAAIEFNGQVYGTPEAIDQPCQMAGGLRVGGQSVGKVYISYTEEREFLDEESALLGDIVRRVSAYIENRRLTEQTEAALAEATALYRASQAINTATTLDEVLHALMDAMDLPELVRADIALFDHPWTKDDKPEYVETAAFWDKRLEEDENAEPTGAVGARFELEMLPSTRFLKPDEPLVFADVETDPRIDEATHHLFLNVFQVRSALFLPLVAGGQWIGFFGPFLERAVELDEVYLRRLMTLTGQAAVAVQSLLRLQAAQDALTQTETLYAGSEKVVRSANVDDVLQALVESTALQQLDRVSIAFFDRPWEDEQPEEVIVVAAWERGGGELRAPAGTRYAFSQFLVIDTVTADSPAILRDMTTDERVGDNLRTLLVDKMGMRSMGLWPLVVGGQWIGMLSGQSGAVMEMEENEERQITSLVDQAATVIQTQRLFEQTEAALTQTEMLYNTSRALIAAENSQEMLQAVAQPAMELGAQGASLTYVEVDAEGQPEWAEAVASIGGTTLVGTRFYMPEIPLARWWRASPDRPLLIADVDALDKTADEQIIQMMKSIGTHATAVLPLRVGQSWQGMVNISWPEPHEFSSEEEQLFGLISPQLASRILGLRLRGEAERRALWLQTAADVSRATSTILEPTRQMQQVVDLVHDRFDLYYAGLFLVEQNDTETDTVGDAAENQWAVLQVGTGEAGQQMMADGHRLAIGGNSMIGQCLATGRPRVALDVGQEAMRFENPLLPDTSTELALPLISRGRPMGALTIQSERPAAFSEEDVAVLQSMADQLAISIDNASLIEQAQSRAEREQRVRTITDRIRRGADAETIMRVTLEELSHMLGASKAVVRLGTRAQLGVELDDGDDSE